MEKGDIYHYRSMRIRHNILIFLTSKEDHTYVRGEIYQRVIAIRKSKDR
jgi:hypothetical protein